MPKRTQLLLLCTLIMTASLSACLARGGVRGELRTELDVNLGVFYTATLKTLEVEGLTLKSDAADTATALIKAEYADETPLTIHLSRLTQHATNVTIQVGLFGDRPRSDALLKEILYRVAQADSKTELKPSLNQGLQQDTQPDTQPNTQKEGKPDTKNGLEQMPPKKVSADAVQEL